VTQPRKTIYVREEARELWEKAEKLCDKSLSSLIEELLKDYVTRSRSLKKGNFVYSKILVRPDSTLAETTLHAGVNSFEGHLLVQGYPYPLTKAHTTPPKGYFHVAVTPKGNFVFWEQKDEGADEYGIRNVVFFRVHASLEEAGGAGFDGEYWWDQLVELVLHEMKKLWVEYYHELDI